jgi:type I restriction enzyme S subunit
VPEGWEWCRLNSIATFELGKTLDTAKNTGTYKPYLRSVNVRWNSIDLNDINCMKFAPNELSRYSITKGDLLICEGGDVGRSCVWEKDEEMYYQNALHRVRFYMNINPYFYMYIMMYYANSGKLQEVCKGVTIKHLTRTTLLCFYHT